MSKSKIVCDGCTELEDDLQYVIIEFPEGADTYSLCKPCRQEAKKRLNSIFSCALDGVLTMTCDGKEPNEEGKFYV